ncbi:hypothetical protein M1247_12215 [Mycobacterium sp. 21AC1]|uniref:hypothetical protein n=1 Tax=[Mycobacterium] appelbergii TaxID=2939269 RepID=UPI002939434E|nr:hypothetical protein [Mycobacterium sp. 21AC1]MDV3125682.1 hypothetical protein [Mycobacterium sp. 21AC1]
MRRLMVAGLAVAAIGLAGCSTVTDGQPMADPDQTGITTPTTTRPAPTTTPRTPRSPTATKPPAPGMASTTCGDYLEMDEATKREVIAAIGADNELIGMNPELWIGMADMMCRFTDKTTLVRDAVTGESFG